MGTADLNIRRPTTVASVPAGQTPVTTGTLTLQAAGDSLGRDIGTFNVITIPDSNLLSMWNFLWSIYVDTNDPAYNWPTGGSLTLTQLRNLRIASHYDWANSSDTTNQRNEKVFCQNLDSSPHTLYFYYKAYTIAPAAAR